MLAATYGLRRGFGVTKRARPPFVWRALWRLWALLAGVVVIATCDTLQTPTDTAVNIKVAYTGDTVLIVGDSIKPVIEVTRDNSPITGPRVRFFSGDSSMVLPDTQGALLVRKRGVTLLKVRLVGSTLGASPPETTVHIVSVAAAARITPATLTIPSLGDSVKTLVAEALDSRDAVIAGATFTWQSSDTSVADVTTSGVVVSKKNGTAVITAVVDNDTAKTNVTVAQVLARYTFRAASAPASTPDLPLTKLFAAIGDTLTLAAVPRDSNGFAIPAGAAPAATWTTPVNQNVASVNTTGLVTAKSNGTGSSGARIQASGGAAVDTMHVDVAQIAKTVQILGPHNITIDAPGVFDTLLATATDSLGQTVQDTRLKWKSDNTGVVVVTDADHGVFKTFGVGTARIIAFEDNGADTATVTVTNTPVELTLTQGNAPISTVSITSVGQQTPTNIVAVTINSQHVNLGAVAVSWLAADPSVVTVNPVSGKTGEASFTAAGVGTTTVTATVTDPGPANGFQATLSVTVTNAPVFLDIIPTQATLTFVGQALVPSVDIRNPQGNQLSRTSVSWTSDDQSIARVSADGTITAVGPGLDPIFIHAFNAASTNIRDSIQVTVTNAPVAVTLDHSNDTLTAPSKTIAYSAVITNSNNASITNPLFPLVWTSTNPAVASVTATGVARALTVGQTLIIASDSGALGLKADTSVLVVQNLPFSMSVTPSSVSLSAVGGTQQLTPTVKNDIGGVISGLTLGYSTSDGSVATVTPTGLVTGVGVGSATITVETQPPSGAVIQTLVLVSVASSSVPATLTVAPAGPTTLAAFGATINFVATVKNAAGAVIPTPNPAVTWSSNSAAVTINATSGLATTVSNGSATITATAGVATANVTVNVGQLASASRSTISSSAPSLTANGTSTATITIQLKDSLGTNLSVSGGVVTLSLSGSGTLPATATDNGNGTYTATLTAPSSIGNGTVSASIGGVSFTTGNPTISYTPSAATKYIVTPSSTTPVVGTSITVSAQLVDVNNNPVTTAGNSVTWSFQGGNGSFTTANPSTTNASGVASVTFTVSSSTTTQLITATDNTALTGTSSPITTISAAANNYLVTPATVSPAAGSGVVITAQLRDGSGNAIALAGQVVTWGTASGSFSTPTSTTNGSGVATITLNTITTSGTPTTVTATTGGVSGTSATITPVPGAAAAATTTIGASGGGTFAAGGSVTITVTAKDANSNLLTVSGGTVALHTTLGSLTTVIDNGNGTYTATLSSSATGTATVSGTINGVAITSGNPLVTVTQAAVSALLSTASVPAGASGSVTTITVQAKDANGNNRTSTSGALVVLVTGANNATASVTDNLNGTYSATYTPAVAGSDAIAITLGGTAIGGSPYTSVVVPAGLASFVVETAGGGSIATQTAGTAFNIRVTARDANGNLVTTFNGGVDITSTGTLSSAITNVSLTNGVLASQAVTITNTGSFTITATKTVGGTPSTASNSFSVVAGAASLTTSTITSNQASLAAGQTAAITVTLKDANNVPLTTSGGTVALATNLGTLSAVTNANNGTYTATFTATTAGAAVISGTLNGAALTSTAPITVTASTATLAQSTVTANPTSITASGSSIATITIQLKDANGNNTATASGAVTLQTSAGTLLATLVDNGNGNFTQDLQSTTATGPATLTGKIGASSITNTATVTFVAGAATTAQSTITLSPASPATVTVGTAVTITVQLQDVNANNLTASGGTVVIARTGTGSITPTTDNGNGTYTATLNSAVIGSATISATLNTVAITGSGTPSVTFTSDNATSIAVNGGNNQTANAGVVLPTNPSVVVRDANGNPVAGRSVTFQVAANNGLINGGTADVIVATDGAGLAALSSWTLHTTAGTNTVTATATGLTGSPVSFTATGTVGAASLTASTVTSDAPGGTRVAGQTATITVTLKDANSNNLTTSGGTVALATNLGTLSAVTNNNNGTYTATFTATTAGAATISATLNGAALTSTAAITVTAGAASAAITTIAASPTSVPTDGTTSTITVQAKDAFGNNRPSTADVVTITASPGGALTVGGGTNGAYTATLPGSTTAGVVTIAATIEVATVPTAISSGNATVTRTAGTATTGNSTITLSPVSGSTPPVGTPVTVTVQLQDANNNPTTSGLAVVIGRTGVGSITGTTNLGGGAYTATLTSTANGLSTISATLDGVAIAGSPTITWLASAATQIAASAGTGQSAVAGGAVTTAPAVTVRDANGNPKGSVNVTFSVAANNGLINGATADVIVASDATTGIAALSSWTLHTTAGTNTVTATATGLTGSPVSFTATGTVGAASLTASTVTSDAPGGTLVAGQTATITVQLKDANSNNLTVSGGTVALATNLGTLSSVTNANNGTYTATYTATTAGAAVISGTLNGAALTSTAPITVTAGAATQLTVTQSPTANPQSGIPFAPQPTIQLRDAQGNAVTTAGVSIIATLTAGGGSLTGTTTQLTDAGGLATFTDLVITGTTGARTLTFAKTGGGLTVATANVTLAAGAATQLAVIQSPSANPQNAIVFPTQPTVQLRDADGNAVATAGVDVQVTGSGLGGTTTVQTSSNGLATFTNLSITGTIGARTLTFGSPTVAGSTLTTTTANVTLVAGTATQLAMATQPSGTATVGSVFAQQPVVEIRDVSDNVVLTNNTTIITAARSGGTGTLQGTLTATAQSGVATFTNLAHDTPSTITILFTASGLTSVTSSSVVVTGGTHYDVTAASTPVDAGTVVLITAQLADASHTPVAQSGKTVVWSKTCNAGVCAGGATGGSFATPSSITDANGRAVIALTVSTVSTTVHTVTATDNTALTGTSGNITVQAGTFTLAQSTISASPLSGVKADGVASSTVTIQAKDQFGNNTSVGVTTVTAALSGSATNASLTSFTNNGGGNWTATLTSTTFGSAIVNGKINGSDITNGSNPVTVTFVASRLVLTGNATPTAGVGETVTITAKDADGNTATSYTGSKDLIFGGASNALTSQQPTADGVNFGTTTPVTFTTGAASVSMILYRAETTNITATTTAPTTPTISTGAGADRLSVTVSAATTDAAQSTVVRASPGTDVLANNTATETITVTLKDQYQNVVTSGKTVSLDDGAATSTITPASTTSNGSGQAVFTVKSNVAEDATYTATASDPGAIVITPTATVTFVASHLAVTGTTTPTAGGSFNITVTAKDGAGNTATNYTASKNLIFSGPANAPLGTVPTFGGSAIGSTLAITFTNGVSTLIPTVLYKAETVDINVTTTVPTTPTISSSVGGDPLNVTVADAGLDNFAFSLTSPQTTAVAFTGTNTLTARDVYHNTVTGFDASGDNVLITVSPSGTVSGLSGGATLVLLADFASGVANLTGTLKYTRSAAETLVTFTATSQTTAKTGTSNAVTINP
jgi:adhesin/invasin